MYALAKPSYRKINKYTTYSCRVSVVYCVDVTVTYTHTTKTLTFGQIS